MEQMTNETAIANEQETTTQPTVEHHQAQKAEELAAGQIDESFNDSVSDSGEAEQKDEIVIENESLRGFVDGHIQLVERSISIDNSKSSMMQSMFATIEACSNTFPEETLHFLKNEIPAFIEQVEKSIDKRKKFSGEALIGVKRFLRENGVI